MPDDNQIKPRIALGAIIFCIAYLAFIFVYDDLRKEAFVQGVTGLLIALAIAVILFSAVPSSSVIKTVVGLTGAAAFYVILLPCHQARYSDWVASA
jgi:hypothetical protein